MHPSWNDYPHLVAELDPDGNKDLTRHGKPISVLELTIGTNKHLDWKCNICCNKWRAAGDSRKRGEKRCPACDNPIVKFNAIHGDKYDYSRVNYVNAKTKIEIRCKEHDVWFHQTPEGHKRRKACPECKAEQYQANADKLKITFDQFKERVEKIQGEGVLDFSRVDLVNTQTKIWLRHIPCGDTWYQIRPNAMLKHGKGGQQLGCPVCRYRRAGDTNYRKKTTEQWIAEARKTHGDLYIYHSEYTNNKGMMDIECTICDTKFSQEAKSHATYGQGCPKCRYVKSAAGIRLDFDEILKRLETRRQETGKHYRYPNLTAEKYTSTRDKCEIVCPDCNRTFTQTLAKHIDRRQGCGACATTGFQPDQLGYYYVHKIFNESGDILMYKAGISGDWKTRLQQLRRGIPDHLTMELHEVIDFEIGQDAQDLETTMLRKAAEEGWKAPPRKFDGGSELFLENPLDHARIHGLI